MVNFQFSFNIWEDVTLSIHNTIRHSDWESVIRDTFSSCMVIMKLSGGPFKMTI